ncbi:hypothetical protein TNCV_477481 [Trichonephila clavipes]|nr:hypothetical protein TNCV_477481 [Trichonephila clavipes]
MAQPGQKEAWRNNPCWPGPTAHPSRPLGAEEHEQMSQTCGQSEARTAVLKSPKQAFGTHLSTHCSRDERLSRPCPSRE